jgi:hypothetical protein
MVLLARPKQCAVLLYGVACLGVCVALATLENGFEFHRIPYNVSLLRAPK